MRDLIRRDQERAFSAAEFQALIIEGLESGVSERSLDRVLDAARREAEAARDDGP